MVQRRVLLFLMMFLVTVNAASQSPVLKTSQQLILVQVPNTHSFQGKMQRYQRLTRTAAWKIVGTPIPVVIGQHGMTLHKQEGDRRTPIGFFRLGPVFGFDALPVKDLKMPYYPLTARTICVDDPHSRYYNQLLEDSPSARPDWHSGEKMRQVAVYQQGAVVEYNRSPVKVSAGSCIFLHRWAGPEQGTAGCVAMDPMKLRVLLTWLDSNKQPVIGFFPKK